MLGKSLFFIYLTQQKENTHTHILKCVKEGKQGTLTDCAEKMLLIFAFLIFWCIFYPTVKLLIEKKEKNWFF